MAEFPALPLWTDAYLADTIHLTPEQHGIYFLLLLHTWRSPGCKIPNDDHWLSLRFRMPVEWIREQVRPLIVEFFAVRDAMLTQKRLSAEYSFVTKSRQKRVQAAKARWEKRKDPYNASSNAYAPTTHNPHLYNSPSENIGKQPKPTPRSELGSVLDPERAAAVIEHRKRMRKPLTAHAAKLLAKQFSHCADPNAAADQMIERGWQGFKPSWLNETNGGGHGKRKLSDLARDFSESSASEPDPGAPLRLFPGGRHERRGSG